MKRIEGYEVVVVGGGPGGFGAAVTAARSGARTVLIEREGCLGGGATTMFVHPFMSELTTPASAGEPRKVCNAGVFRDVIDRLAARGAAVPRAGGAPRFDDEAMKVVLDELLTEAGADVFFHAALFGLRKRRGRLGAVHVAHNGGPLEVAGRVFIDATGDALLAAVAGCEVQVGDEQGLVMPMTLNFAVAGADLGRLPSIGDLKTLCAAGAADDPPLLNTHLSCFSLMPNGQVHFNAIRIPGDTLDPLAVSRAEMEARRRVQNFVAWLRAKVPAFAACYLVKTGSHIGIRESRRVVGDYVLTAGDFKRCARFDDAIACTSYGIDKHLQQPNQTLHDRLPPGECYQVPYRCLTPKGTTNLLVASRSISADVLVHSSLRIMPPVMNIGEAAGYAAALALPRGDVRKVRIAALQDRIRAGRGLLEPRSLADWPDHYAAKAQAEARP